MPAIPLQGCSILALCQVPTMPSLPAPYVFRPNNKKLSMRRHYQVVCPDDAPAVEIMHRRYAHSYIPPHCEYLLPSHPHEFLSSLLQVQSEKAVHPYSRFRLHYFLCLPMRQVLIPNILYNAQLPISAVTSGKTPSQPHQPIFPIAEAAINATPITMRMTRSKVPKFRFILLLLV